MAMRFFGNQVRRQIHAASAALLMSSDDPDGRSNFEARVDAANLPPPGPDHYLARRQLWLTPTGHSPQHQSRSDSSSRNQLEHLLSAPDALTDPAAWRSIQQIWSNFAGGRRLRKRLPMSVVVKICQAVWMHDDTWPVGMTAPEPDDVPQNPAYPTTSALPSQYQSQSQSSAPTDPWPLEDPSSHGLD